MLPPLLWFVPAPQIKLAGIVALMQIEPPVDEYCQERHGSDSEQFANHSYDSFGIVMRSLSAATCRKSAPVSLAM